jgi:hypothetical protein
MTTTKTFAPGDRVIVTALNATRPEDLHRCGEVLEASDPEKVIVKYDNGSTVRVHRTFVAHEVTA